jgi:hypothetical protein
MLYLLASLRSAAIQPLLFGMVCFLDLKIQKWSDAPRLQPPRNPTAQR